MDMGGSYKMLKDYGGGVFRRRIRLTRYEDRVHGELEDCNHGFKVTVHHRDNQVSKIEPEFMRIPFSTCDGADTPLQKLVGVSMQASMSELLDTAPPLSNCTHLHDLTLLAITHIHDENSNEVVYDIEVTDAVKGVSDLRVSRNGTLIHEWQSAKGMVIAPEPLNEKPLFMGFTRWANDMFSGLENEAAFILQKGNLVSIGRMIDVEGMAGGRAIDETDRQACYTYSKERSSEAVRLAGTVRDFTDTPEQLLKFI